MPPHNLKPGQHVERSRKFPGSYRIWITHQKAEKWVTGFYRHGTGLGLTSSLPPPPEPGVRRRNTEAITWGMGTLLIYLNATADPRVFDYFKLERVGPLLKLWPLDNDIITWPPRYYVTDNFIDDLSTALERFTDSGALYRLDD